MSVTISPWLTGERDALERVDRPVVDVDVVDLEDRPAGVLNRMAASPEVRLDHALVRLDLRRRALRDLLAVLEHRDALGDAHDDLHVVLDEQHGDALLVAQAVRRTR